MAVVVIVRLLRGLLQVQVATQVIIGRSRQGHMCLNFRELAVYLRLQNSVYQLVIDVLLFMGKWMKILKCSLRTLKCVPRVMIGRMT